MSSLGASRDPHPDFCAGRQHLTIEELQQRGPANRHEPTCTIPTLQPPPCLSASTHSPMATLSLLCCCACAWTGLTSSSTLAHVYVCAPYCAIATRVSELTPHPAVVPFCHITSRNRHRDPSGPQVPHHATTAAGMNVCIKITSPMPTSALSPH